MKMKKCFTTLRRVVSCRIPLGRKCRDSWVHRTPVRNLSSRPGRGAGSARRRREAHASRWGLLRHCCQSSKKRGGHGAGRALMRPPHVASLSSGAKQECRWHVSFSELCRPCLFSNRCKVCTAFCAAQGCRGVFCPYAPMVCLCGFHVSEWILETPHGSLDAMVGKAHGGCSLRRRCMACPPHRTRTILLASAVFCGARLRTAAGPRS